MAMENNDRKALEKEISRNYDAFSKVRVFPAGARGNSRFCTMAISGTAVLLQ